MVLIQFFENDKTNRELILDHLWRNSILRPLICGNSKANDTI
jgi:hypothetical protein